MKIITAILPSQTPGAILALFAAFALGGALGGVGLKAGTPSAPSSPAAVAAPVDDVPKTLDELNALELERDKVHAHWCWEVTGIAMDYRDVRNYEEHGAGDTVSAKAAMEEIRPRLVRLRNDEVQLADLNRRINAARDRVHSK